MRTLSSDQLLPIPEIRFPPDPGKNSKGEKRSGKSYAVSSLAWHRWQTRTWLIRSEKPCALILFPRLNCQLALGPLRQEISHQLDSYIRRRSRTPSDRNKLAPRPILAIFITYLRTLEKKSRKERGVSQGFDRHITCVIPKRKLTEFGALQMRLPNAGGIFQIVGVEELPQGDEP